MKKPSPIKEIPLEVQRRLDALERLIDTSYEGKVAVFSAKTGIAPPQVNQWFTGYRMLRENAVRRLEKATSKPPGWFDAIENLDISPQPMFANTSPADCMQVLGDTLLLADPLTRAQIAPLLQALVDGPDHAHELGRRLQITLESSGVVPPAPPSSRALATPGDGQTLSDLERTLERLSAFLQAAPAHTLPMVQSHLSAFAGRPLDWKQTAAALRPLLTFDPGVL